MVDVDQYTEGVDRAILVGGDLKGGQQSCYLHLPGPGASQAEVQQSHQAAAQVAPG